MSKIIKEAQKHLQQKREKYHRQEEKIEEMKCTMQHTEKEIKQLEYALEVIFLNVLLLAVNVRISL